MPKKKSLISEILEDPKPFLGSPGKASAAPHPPEAGVMPLGDIYDNFVQNMLPEQQPWLVFPLALAIEDAPEAPKASAPEGPAGLPAPPGLLPKGPPGLLSKAPPGRLSKAQPPPPPRPRPPMQPPPPEVLALHRRDPRPWDEWRHEDTTM